MTRIARVARPALAFYLGAAFALALPFASPLWEPFAFGARIISALAGTK